jgi:copper chaperone CopZ
MKIFIGIISSLFIWITSLQSTQKTTFKVFGNCTECKERIEQALDVKGVQVANWNIDSKQLFVKYDAEKISIAQIHTLIAAVGHDTDKMKAPDSVYIKLPDCCLFRSGDNTHHD